MTMNADIQDRIEVATGPPYLRNSARLLVPTRFSTAELPERHQFEAWRAHCSAWIDVSPLEGQISPRLLAETSIWHLGPMALTVSSGEGVLTRRDAQRARRDQLDHFIIAVLRRGKITGRAFDMEFEFDRRSPWVTSMDLPHSIERNEAEWVMLFVPRDAIPEASPTLESLLCRPLDSPMGRLLRVHLDELANELPHLTLADAAHSTGVTLALIRAAVTGSTAALGNARPRFEAAARAQVMALVRENLGSCRFGPARLARLAGMSRTQLYRLFEPEGGVACAILAKRMAAVRRALADPHERRTIGRIAEEAGLPDPSVFARAFRREFGMTPTEFREDALAGLAVATSAEYAQRRSLDSFGDVLRRLHG